MSYDGYKMKNPFQYFNSDVIKKLQYNFGLDYEQFEALCKAGKWKLTHSYITDDPYISKHKNASYFGKKLDWRESYFYKGYELQCSLKGISCDIYYEILLGKEEAVAVCFH
jgi:hypothetical protein